MFTSHLTILILALVIPPTAGVLLHLGQRNCVPICQHDCSLSPGTIVSIVSTVAVEIGPVLHKLCVSFASLIKSFKQRSTSVLKMDQI